MRAADSACLFVLSNGRHFGGAEKSITAVLPYLGRAVRTVIFAANDRHCADLEALAAPNVEVVRLAPSFRPLSQFRNLRLIWQRCRRDRPQAILGNGHRGSILLFFLRFLPYAQRPRFAVYVRDFAYGFFRLGLWAMRDFLYFAPTQAIFDNERYVRWGLTRCHHRVIGNAVPALDAEIPPDATQPRYIGCCARIVPWKGIDYLLRAFALVVAQRPEARLRVYGEPIDEAYYQSLLQLTRDLGLEAQVEFFPFANDMATVFRQGLVFVVPSLSVLPGPESFCRIIIEAWAFRRPVVAFVGGGPSYLIENGQDGFLVEEKNFEALAGRIEELLGDPALARRMGLAGFEKVQRHFTPAAVARELLAQLIPELPATP